MISFKKSSKIPFTLSIALHALSWTLLCAFFCVFFIITQANFEATGTKRVFIISFLLYIGIAALSSAVEYGALRMLGIKKERRILRVLNDNIINKHLLPDLPLKTLKEVFNFLSRAPMDPLKAGLKYIVLVISLSILTEWVASGETTNIPVIFIGGLISLFLYVLFVGFFTENSIFFTLKECRELLLKRGEEIKERGLKFNELKVKLNLFLSIPVLVILIVLNFIVTLNLEIVLLFLIGLGLIAMISYTLSRTIYRAFSEIKDFAKRLPKGERSLFATGSLDKEIISLSGFLNQAANKIYTSREELEKSKEELEDAKTCLEIKIRARTRELIELNESLEQRVEERTQEMQKRVDELNRFYKLTVGRELKMVELKKEIKELEEQLKKQGK